MIWNEIYETLRLRYDENCVRTRWPETYWFGSRARCGWSRDLGGVNHASVEPVYSNRDFLGIYSVPGVAAPSPGTPVIQNTTPGDEAILISECEWSALKPVTIQ